jgi:hypothetical protein
MSVISDALRPLWLPGIQTVVGRPMKGLQAYILDGQFQIYVPPTNRSAELSFAESLPILSAFAFDITRFASAAIESIAESRPDQMLPKSTAWLMIRSYYAAFFAAHAIARMLGTSYTRFEGTHSNAIYKISNAYLMAPGAPPTAKLGSGLYKCAVDTSAKVIRFGSIGDGAGGSHESFWASFLLLMKETSQKILVSKIGTPANNLIASESLESLCTVLNSAGRSGAWLSQVRNSINYQQAYGCWFPYHEPIENSRYTLLRAHKWKNDLATITPALSSGNGELHRFQGASQYLVSLCREMAIDMSERAPRGKSFQSVGVLAMLKTLRISAEIRRSEPVRKMQPR